MTIRQFTWLFFSFLGVGLSFLAATMILALFAPYPADKGAKIVLASFAMWSIGGAFVTDALCGIKHGKMWQPMNSKISDSNWLDIVMYLGLTALFFAVGFRTWNGIIPVKL
jgi:hypothetical protein